MKEPQSGVGHGLSTTSWNKRTQLSTTKQGKKLLLGVRGKGHDMSTMSCNKHTQFSITRKEIKTAVKGVGEGARLVHL